MDKRLLPSLKHRKKRVNVWLRKYCTHYLTQQRAELLFRFYFQFEFYCKWIWSWVVYFISLFIRDERESTASHRHRVSHYRRQSLSSEANFPCETNDTNHDILSPPSSTSSLPTLSSSPPQPKGIKFLVEMFQKLDEPLLTCSTLPFVCLTMIRAIVNSIDMLLFQPSSELIYLLLANAKSATHPLANQTFERFHRDDGLPWYYTLYELHNMSSSHHPSLISSNQTTHSSVFSVDQHHFMIHNEIYVWKTLVNLLLFLYWSNNFCSHAFPQNHPWMHKIRTTFTTLIISSLWIIYLVTANISLFDYSNHNKTFVMIFIIIVLQAANQGLKCIPDVYYHLLLHVVVGVLLEGWLSSLHPYANYEVFQWSKRVSSTDSSSSQYLLSFVSQQSVLFDFSHSSS